jgi:hypothetical protein
MSALSGCLGTSTSVAVLLIRERGVASLGGHRREDAGTERVVFADGAVRAPPLPHPDARIARTAKATAQRIPDSLRRQQDRPRPGWLRATELASDALFGTAGDRAVARGLVVRDDSARI